ncbi:MAG TPA: amidase [Candidatus Binataceae bacterium]|nr:amidase [Candidatus Binataceae bacterium]
MALRRPVRDELKELASANHFALDDVELADFEALIPGMFATLDNLDRAPSPVPSVKYPERDRGFRPEAKDDPLNAILRRCSVKGARSGKLAGKRIGIKDCFAVAGIPMTCGSLVMDGYVPETDATLVTRILDAGGEIVAKLNMDNFAFSGAGDTSAFGPTRNPHDHEHLAGGSSGGSGAALYYDDIDITIGGDQGGSIRIPASWCGVVGLKPTHGLVPYTGCVGIDPTFDHAGPLGRTVADVALMLEVIAGKDPLDPRQQEVTLQPYTKALGRDLKGVRVGVLREGFGLPGAENDVDAAVSRAVQALSGLGAQVKEVSVPAHRQADGVVWGLIAEGAAALMYGNGVGYHFRGYYDAGLASALGRFRKAQGEDLPPTLKLVLLVGSFLNRHYHGRLYGKAQNMRASVRAAYDTVLEQVDALMMPTTPIKALRYTPNLRPRAIIERSSSMVGNTAVFDMTGHPSISVPCALSAGLPVGMMLTGRHFDEMTLLSIADAYERNVDWRKAG